MIWFLIKIIIFTVLAILVRGTLPRYRIDQLISLNWKIFIYLYVGFLVIFIIDYYILL